MSNLSISIMSRRPSTNTEAAHLNVMPVMNMFIILIPFLISMSAFIHLAAHQFSLPGDDSPEQAIERLDLPLTVAVGLEGLVVVQGDFVLAEFPKIEGAHDLGSLFVLLKEQAPLKVVVAVDMEVPTSNLVSCLDVIGEAGCTDVGLAAGVGVSLSSEVRK
ncbi:MAG: hypothetical protein GY780_02395 [bacterium]|nr:hypothetical protein [bacterium]